MRSSVSWQKEQGWQRAYLYAERGLNAIKSWLSLGDITSSGFIFDGIPLAGIKLASDESMLSLEQWSYSPVIRGVAKTQARVEVKQNGYVIANEIVPSGPFELTQIPSGGGRGALDVTIYENDGSQQNFVVPYDTPVGAVRQGYLGYSVSGGRYHPSDKSVDGASFGSLEIKYGLPFDVTLYTGLQYARHYHSGVFGVAAMLGYLGALSVDMTQARSQKAGKIPETDNKWRLNYTKHFDVGMSFNAAHEFVGQAFNSPSETLNTYCKENQHCFSSLSNIKRKSSINLSRALGKLGYINVMGMHQKYWQDNQSSLSYGLSYSKTVWNNISFNLGLTKNKTKQNKTENLINFWFSLPLRWSGHGNSTYASYQLMNSNQYGDTHELGIYGDSFDQKLRWDIRELYAGKTHRQSRTVNVNYRDTYGEIRGYYGWGDEFRQMGAGISGQALVTQYGITVGQNSGDTIALVRAPDVSGISVGHLPGVKTDFKGNVIVGGLRAYQKNNIEIDPTTLPHNAFIQKTSVSVIPTKGAVVAAELEPVVGEQLLLTVMRENNKPVPFGAIATLNGSSLNTGIFGDNGTVYLTGVSSKSRIKIRWGKDKGQSCDIDITLPPNKSRTGIYKLKTQCPRV
jgi:outer membrane usher protein